MSNESIEELLKSGIINLAMLARKIYPESSEKAASVRLHKKINNKEGQRLTDDDFKLISAYLKKTFKNIF